MKKTLLLILIFSNFSYSQEIKNKKDWIIKLNSIQLIDGASFPTLQFSAEKKINSYASINTEFGYQIYDFGTKSDTIFFKSRGFKANIEGRIYFQKLFDSRIKSRNKEFYFGLQLFYRQNQNSNSIEYKQDENIYEDNFGVKKSVKGINLIFGRQRKISEKIILESFLVLGYMNRKVRNIELQYDEKKHSTNMNDGIPIRVGYDLNNSNNNFNFGFGFRIGYIL